MIPTLRLQGEGSRFERRHQVTELLEQVARVVGARTGLGVVLHAVGDRKSTRWKRERQKKKKERARRKAEAKGAVKR